MKVLDGEPLSDGDFIIKLTAEEVGIIAYGLMSQANSTAVPPTAWVCEPSRDMAYRFADLVGIH